MRVPWLALAVLAAAVAALMAFTPAASPQPNGGQENADKPDPRIVPVVALKPGECKELLLSTWCRVGATRGGGLTVRGREEGPFQLQTDAAGNRGKVWTRDGVTIRVPDFGEAEKVAAEPVYSPLKRKGLNAFVVKVSAAGDAKPGLIDLHLADSTCSGNCDTDFRVLVVAP